MEAKKIVVLAIALLAIGTPSIAEFKVKEIGILGGQTTFSTKAEDQYKASDELDLHQQNMYGVEGVLGDSNSTTDLVIGINLASKSKSFTDLGIDYKVALDTSYAKLGLRTHFTDWFFIGAGLNYTMLKATLKIDAVSISSDENAFGFYGESGVVARFEHMKIGVKYVYDNSGKIALPESPDNKFNPTSSSILGFVSYVF